MEVLGVDIGGTAMKIGNVLGDDILRMSYVSVNRELTAKETLASLFKCLDERIEAEISAIGVGVPAVVDPVKGIVYDVQNIPSWKEIPLKEMLEKRYERPVYINNDANCFALGEKYFGKAKAFRNFVGLSIGTGLGMGIIIDDKLYNGVLSGAGELGMVAYREGILENYASSFFFLKHYKMSGKELYEMAGEGNKRALQAFKEFGSHLGEAVKNILYMYAPEAIIFGGSISKAYPFFRKSMEHALKSFAYPKQLENLEIECSDLRESAVLGAAALCRQI
ncbi:ROK family protein [Flavobacteriaceae bacterium 3-367]|uniref:ROK family protein n=1 Tax=Eudoraea algarum TaxID=3417568 RepID=UPI00326B4F82